MSITPFLLADIGEGIAEVELMKWFVKEGDQVKSFDRLCEVQSDKATVELTSRYDGEIVKIHHKEGDIVEVCSYLLTAISEGGECFLFVDQVGKALVGKQFISSSFVCWTFERF